MGLFGGKGPMTIRHPMTLRHPVPCSSQQHTFQFTITAVSLSLSHTHTHTHTHAHTCTHAHTHTHTHFNSQSHKSHTASPFLWSAVTKSFVFSMDREESFVRCKGSCSRGTFWYRVAAISRLLKIIGLFCKRAL